MGNRSAILTLVILGASCASALQTPPSTEVQTTGGTIAGIASSDGKVTSFKGIPYAAPPVGPLRWQAPRPVHPWTGVRPADHFGASCMQGSNAELLPWTKEFMYVTPASEDCLFLNIWTPALAASAKLPVLVFIHGGAFTSGSGDVPVYDGEPLASTGMVIVTINYRLGVFGFLAHPALTAESEYHTSGNYGLLDEIAALEWLKQNLQHFGGDPAHLAIAGQSAGAASVADLVASPLAKGLFSVAIADSGISGRGLPMATLAEAEKKGEAFAAGKKADSLAALRAIPAKDLGVQHMGPIVDGWLLPDDPITLTTERGLDNDVPVITGFQANDSQSFSKPATSAADYEKKARQTYGPMADEFLKLYPAATDDAVKQAMSDAARDRLKSGMYLWGKKRTETHNGPVYEYYFDRAIPWPAHPEFGAFHTGEIPYAFGTLKTLDRPWEPVDFQVSKMMMTYWKNIASAANPNGPSVPKWAPVNPSKPSIMRLGATPEPIPPADPTKLAFWTHYFESPQSKNAPPF